MNNTKKITFNYLGHLGRIGNQMFQYASLLGISNHKGYDYTLPANNMNHILLYDCFELDNPDMEYEVVPDAMDDDATVQLPDAVPVVEYSTW